MTAVSLTICRIRKQSKALTDVLLSVNSFVRSVFTLNVDSAMAGPHRFHIKMKKVWEEGNQSIAVYEASASGEPQFVIVTRYKQGLKEREEGFREPLQARYVKAHGQDGWNKYLTSAKEILSHQSGEMMFYKPELSSK